MNPWQKILALLFLSIFVYLFFVYSIKTPTLLEPIQLPNEINFQKSTLKSELKPILPQEQPEQQKQTVQPKEEEKNLPQNDAFPLKTEAIPTTRHVLAVAESSNEGPGYEKERISEVNDSWWNTKKDAGFPQWIVFDIGKEEMKAINFRNKNGCATAPKDVVFYHSDSLDGPWIEIASHSRPKSPGGVWWQAPVQSNKKYVKAEFVNNQSSVGPAPANKQWATYTYLYEVTVENW